MKKALKNKPDFLKELINLGVHRSSLVPRSLQAMPHMHNVLLMLLTPQQDYFTFRVWHLGKEKRLFGWHHLYRLVIRIRLIDHK